MTYEEANACVKRINELQNMYWHGDSAARAEVKREWYPLCLSIKMGGFILKRNAIKDEHGFKVGCDWYVKEESNKKKLHSESLEYVNLRPEGVKTRVGDCTTRCIAYCLGKTYESVLREQKRMEKKTLLKYNDCDIWDEPLTKRGWVRIELPHKIVRHELAKMLSCFKKPIATSSSGHVCPIHHGKVIDVWQSQNGRVELVVVRKQDAEKVRAIVNKFC